MILLLLRLQSQIRQLDRAEERAKQKPQKPKKKEFTAMHVCIKLLLLFIYFLAVNLQCMWSEGTHEN